MTNSFNARTTLQVGARSYEIWSLAALPARQGGAPALLAEDPAREPAAFRGRRQRHAQRTSRRCSNWDPKAAPSYEISFTPARVIMQDFTGVPAIVDLAAMREAMVRLGGDPDELNPLAPAELVIDHSVQVDDYGAADSLRRQQSHRIRAQRRALLLPALGPDRVPQFQGRAAQHRHRAPGQSRVPGARGIRPTRARGAAQAYPDTLVGTDSHTTMINGLGRARLGRRRHRGRSGHARPAGHDADSAGHRLQAARQRCRPGATATDLVLTVTEMLRKKGVVDKFVEFFGDGLANLPLADRATIGNMSPEFGSTCAIFPIDEETIRYLQLSGPPARTGARWSRPMRARRACGASMARGRRTTPT